MQTLLDVIGDAFEVFVGSESKGRTGQFFTPRSVTDLLVEAVSPSPDETIIDPACGAGGFLTSVIKYHQSNGVSFEKLSSIAKTSLFGIDKDDYLAKLARLHISLLTGGHPNIYCGDSLSQANGLKDIKEKRFDIILTNPPFGSKIVAANEDVLKTFELARKWKFDSKNKDWICTPDLRKRVPPQVLFIERCFSLLRDGGRVGMVVPESILSNKSYEYVTNYILSNSDIQAIIGMPEALFKTSGKGGTHTKTCLLITKKISDSKRKSKKIFMAEAKWCGHDSRARVIPNNDLPEVSDNLKKYSVKKISQESHLGFTVDKNRIKNNVLCPRYYNPTISQELIHLNDTHDLVLFNDLLDRGILEISTGDELGKLAYGTGDIPFVRTSDISNWELKADPKHGVDRSFYDSLKKKQDVQVNDILMVKDGTYLIGTCAIVTEFDQEIIYQSHLYKVRVRPNDTGLNSFLLLAILSCPIVNAQIRSKQFSQDIIDSLGGRIKELILPIPKSEPKRKRITSMVQQSINDRVEARELAKLARAEVVGK